MNEAQKKKSHTEQIQECFDITSPFFQEMMKIISRSDKAKEPLHKHHIVPRSYFSKIGEPIDNSNNNIAYLTPYEHCWAHYYAWKCSTPLMKKSMASAFHFMVNTATKGIRDIDTIAKEYSRATVDMMSTKKDVNKRLVSLQSTFKCIEVKDKILFRCQKCGFEKVVSRSWHKPEAVCKYCSFSDNRPYKGQYPKIMIIAFDKKAYYISGQKLPSNKTKSNTYSKLLTYAARKINEFEEGTILKWKVVGAWDENILLKDCVRKISTKSEVESFVYWWDIDKRLARYFYPTLSTSTALEYAKYYGIKYDNNIICKQSKNLYYIEEFNGTDEVIGVKTVQEWEEILGYTWVTINKKYHVKKCNPVDMMEIILNEYKKDPTILDRIKEELDKWHK